MSYGLTRLDPQEERAWAAVPVLMQLSTELLELAESVMLGRVVYDQHDPKQMMVLSFVSKQRDHMRSIRALVHYGLHGDAELIARTMLEGMVQLNWAFQGPDDRPALWYWFGLIMDWRQIMENEANGRIESKKVLDLLFNELDKRGSDYYSPKALKRLGEGKSLQADPYRRQWFPGDIAALFSQIQASRLYDDGYRIMSENAHWNPRNLFRSLDFQDQHSVIYKTSDGRKALGALVYGFAAFHQSLSQMDQLFDLNLQAELVDLSVRFGTESDKAK